MLLLFAAVGRVLGGVGRREVHKVPVHPTTGEAVHDAVAVGSVDVGFGAAVLCVQD